MEQLGDDSHRFASELSTDSQGDPLLKLRGELDMSSAVEFRETIEQLLEKSRKRLVFDLSDLSFMDSSGIAVLVFAANNVDAIEVRHSSPIIKRIVEATGLTDFLRIDQK